MDQVAQVRGKIDIVALISEFITLKKIGRNFTTVCPFHNEKTPSFVVSPERQIWHCFGCSLGGDCFAFLMQYERVEFPEALRILAKRVGIELKRSPLGDSVASAKEKIYVLNRLACEYYHFVLTQHRVGEKAREYLGLRKIKNATWKTFMLGFAPNQGDALLQYLVKKKGYARKDLIDAGLATQRGDFFINRLIFPIFDHRDNIIGFSGRVLSGISSQMPKYINTRETLAYHKGDVFFGLNMAKQAIKKENRAIIVEGELDVISCFQQGITNVVAIKGTALTEQQAMLVSRFASKVSLCFDADEAGQEAIKRSLTALEKRGLTTAIILPPEGKDADEAIQTNPLRFKKVAEHAINVYDYLISKEITVYDKSTAEGKKKIADAIMPLLALIENEIVKEHYLKKLAHELDTSYESMVRQVERMQKKDTNVSMVHVKDKRSRSELLEEYLFALILQHNALALIKVTAPLFSDVMFVVPAYEKIYKFLLSLEEEKDISHKSIVGVLPAELLSAFDICYLLPLPQFSTDELLRVEVFRVARELQVLSLRTKIKNVGDKIRELENKLLKSPAEENTDILLLRNEFSDLVIKLRSITSS